MASTSRASKFSKGLNKERTTQSNGTPGTGGAAPSETAPRRTATGRPSPVERRGRKTQKTRITVDLDRARYEFLRDFAADNEARGTEVLRAALDLMESDDEVAARVAAALDEAYDQA